MHRSKTNRDPTYFNYSSGACFLCIHRADFQIFVCWSCRKPVSLTKCSRRKDDNLSRLCVACAPTSVFLDCCLCNSGLPIDEFVMHCRDVNYIFRRRKKCLIACSMCQAVLPNARHFAIGASWRWGCDRKRQLVVCAACQCRRPNATLTSVTWTTTARAEIIWSSLAVLHEAIVLEPSTRQHDH